MKNSFSDLGLRKGQIYEAIISTYTPEGKPTASPMGIIASNSRICIRPFKETSLLKSLLHSKCGVANFTLNPHMFYVTAFKEKNPRGKLPENFFEPARSIKAPRIRHSSFYLEFEVDKIIDEDDRRPQVNCVIRNVETADEKPYPYCRGLFASIECIIHATRIRKYIHEKRFAEAKNLIRLVKYYKSLVERVSPDTVYSEIIDDILKDVDRWKSSL